MLKALPVDRLQRAAVMAVISALHVLLVMLLADAAPRRPIAPVVTPIEVSLIAESRPPPPPPAAPAPSLQQFAQVQVVMPELKLELPVEAPLTNAARTEPVRANIGPVRTNIKLLSSLAISAYYPRLSLRLKEEGVVTNTFCVNEEGQVTSLQVTRSSGYKRLDEAALRLTRDSRWKAGTLNGQPVPSCALHTLTFFLTPNER
jgi:protein TonB